MGMGKRRNLRKQSDGGKPEADLGYGDGERPECLGCSEVDGNYELEHFDHFICRILATYADETVLNEQGKIDYHTFKPVLFEFPTYEYFVTGEKVGSCGKMN